MNAIYFIISIPIGVLLIATSPYWLPVALIGWIVGGYLKTLKEDYDDFDVTKPTPTYKVDSKGVSYDWSNSDKK